MTSITSSVIGEGSPFALWTKTTAAFAMRTVAVLTDCARSAR